MSLTGWRLTGTLDLLEFYIQTCWYCNSRAVYTTNESCFEGYYLKCILLVLGLFGIRCVCWTWVELFNHRLIGLLVSCVRVCHAAFTQRYWKRPMSYLLSTIRETVWSRLRQRSSPTQRVALHQANLLTLNPHLFHNVNFFFVCAASWPLTVATYLLYRYLQIRRRESFSIMICNDDGKRSGGCSMWAGNPPNSVWPAGGAAERLGGGFWDALDWEGRVPYRSITL